MTRVARFEDVLGPLAAAITREVVEREEASPACPASQSYAVAESTAGSPYDGLTDITLEQLDGEATTATRDAA